MNDREILLRWLARMEKHLSRGETDDDCIIWTGAKDAAGYGVARDWAGKVRRVHIQFYEYHTGAPVPADEVVDHECRIRCCCNYLHLQSKSSKENTLIGVGPTAINAQKTHCGVCGAPFDEANTQWHAGRRECKACIRRRRQAKRKEKVNG